MGVILSRFKKKKTTLEVLEGLEKDIKSIEEYGETTEQQHKAVVGRLLLFSVGLYVLTASLFYVFFFPASLYDQFMYVIPLMLFPLIIVLVKRLVSWWYGRKISQNQYKLADMKKQKKELLEEVMDKETYKVARQILEKFAPEQLRKSSASAAASAIVVRAGLDPGKFAGHLALNQRGIVAGSTAGSAGTELRRRPLGTQIVPTVDRLPLRQMAKLTSGTPRLPSPGVKPTGPMMTRGSSPPMRLTRPVLSRERTVMDRLVEYLVGDGINQRYALICSNCSSHNGMALKEEFEYLAFWCCYCFHWNPARKQRLQSPRLQVLPSSGNTTTSSSPAESNTEEEEDTAPRSKKTIPREDEKENKAESHERKASTSSSDGIGPANAESAESPSSTEAEFESLVPDTTAAIPPAKEETAKH